MAAAVTSASITTRIDQLDGCLYSLANLFDKKKWKTLPQQSVLDKDTDYKAFVANFKVKRTQVKGQFDKWLLYGRTILLRTASLDSQATAHIVDAVVPESQVPAVVAAAFVRLVESQFVQAREAVLSATIESLKADCGGLWTARIMDLRAILKAKFASTATTVASSSTAFATALEYSNREVTKKWYLDDRVVTMTDALKEEPLGLDAEHEMRMLLFFLGRSLMNEFKKCFTSYTGTELAVPEARHEKFDPLVEQTLYYISGYILSSLTKEDARRPSAVRSAFVVGNSITHAAAEISSLPHALITARSRRSLIYASSEIYSLVKRLEQIYSSLLTTPNLASHGGALLKKVDDLAAEDETVKDRYSDACLNMMDILEGDGIMHMPDMGPVLLRILQLYMRLRGKDCVKTLMSAVKKSPNSTRSEIAAAIKFAARHANYRTKMADTMASEDSDGDDDDGGGSGGGDTAVVALGDPDRADAGATKKARPAAAVASRCLGCVFGLHYPDGHSCQLTYGEEGGGGGGAMAAES